MYALRAAKTSHEFRVHSRRRRRNPWPARAGRAAAVAVALVALSLGLARVAEGGIVGSTETVVVQPGDSLWSIAQARYPGAEVRTKVYQIEDLNHLRGPAIAVGEKLQVPTR